MLNVTQIKQDFPIFHRHPHLVYLDSGATSLRPKAVIDKLLEYYTSYSANVFRGVYKISEKATKEYEETRRVVAHFINAPNSDEVIFTRNTTESCNLIAYALGRNIIDQNTEIVTTVMEHHSNFVPWQQLAFENGATFKVIGINNEGYLELSADNIKYQKSKIKNTDQILNIDLLEKIITKKTKILSLTYVSNVLGTINPVKEITAKAKQINPQVIVVVDGAQAIPHLKIDVQDLGCDFFVASSHKMFGPSGVGMLWGKYNLLDQMSPFLFGGEMIESVAIDQTTFKKPPHKFEAGTPDIGGVIALKEAVRYLEKIGFENIKLHEQELIHYGLDTLQTAFGSDITIYGPEDFTKRGGIIAFSMKNVHPHDVAQILDEQNVAVRAGHHCAMPLHTALGVPGTTRATFHVYNSKEDIDKLTEGLQKVQKVFAH